MRRIKFTYQKAFVCFLLSRVLGDAFFDWNERKRPAGWQLTKRARLQWYWVNHNFWIKDIVRSFICSTASSRLPVYSWNEERFCKALFLGSFKFDRWRNENVLFHVRKYFESEVETIGFWRNCNKGKRPVFSGKSSYCWRKAVSMRIKLVYSEVLVQLDNG